MSTTPEARHREHDAQFGRARDGVAVLSRDWRIRYANASLLEILDLLGGLGGVETFWDALPGWEHTEEAAELRRAMQSRAFVRFRIDRSRGGGHAWEVTAEPLDSGELQLRLRNVTAQTEKEELERRVQAAHGAAASLERRALFDVLDTLPVGVVVAEAPSGRITYLNPAVTRLTGRAADELEAAGVDDYGARLPIHRPTGEPYPPAEYPLTRALAGESSRDVEMVLRLPAGDERTVLVSGVPLRGADGRVERGMVVFYDITDRLKLERALIDRTREAEHAAADAALRAEESRALREMGRALVSSLDPEDVLRLAGQNAMELLRARGSFFAAPVPGTEEMRILPAMGVLEELDGTRAPLAGSATQLVLREGTQLFNDPERLPVRTPLLPASRRLGVKNLLLVPVRAYGETLGVLGVVDRAGGFGAEDARLLEAFADSAALAVHNARLYAGEHRRAEVNRALLRAAEVLTSTLNPSEVMERMVSLAGELVGADGAGLTLYAGEGGRELRMAVASGLLEPLRGMGGSAEGSLTDEVFRRGAPTVLSASDADGHAGPAWLSRLGVEHYALFPLRAGDERLGVLGLVRAPHRPPFAPEEMETLALLGDQAALAVRNARLYESAQAASRAKDEFLAMMSHELRTPLNALAGFSSLLEEGIYGPLNEAQLGALGRMRTARQHLVELIDQVLDMARVDAGTRRVQAEPVSLPELVRQVSDALRGAAEARGLALQVEVRDPVPVVSTDAGMVRQVLTNLVGNAVKFTERGGITVRLYHGGEDVCLEVGDTGPGISPDLQDRVFEPFFQVDPSTTRREGGVGLGLSLSREFARLLGGELTLRSAPGEGSTFTLQLPAGRS
ncbi:MAG TPA: ATP-binding protein [Longimicrobium sp.]|nr:ATP-binding protein [Longimicrobium sp.]